MAETGHFSCPDLKSRKTLQHFCLNGKYKAVRCHTAVLIVVIMHFSGTKEDTASSTLKGKSDLVMAKYTGQHPSARTLPRQAPSLQQPRHGTSGKKM